MIGVRLSPDASSDASGSPLRIYDVRFGYAAPALAATTRRLEWDPDSPALQHENMAGLAARLATTAGIDVQSVAGQKRKWCQRNDRLPQDAHDPTCHQTPGPFRLLHHEPSLPGGTVRSLPGLANGGAHTQRYVNPSPSRDTSVELGEFVSEALEQIIVGVRTAQEKTAGAVAPLTKAQSEDAYFGGTRRQAQLVEFDIAITATQESGRGAKIGVLAATLGVGVEKQVAEQTERVSRVRFSVPVVFPAPKS